MALTKESVTSIVTKFGKNDKDTGTSEVQIALLTERINQLTEHCKRFKKDKSGQRGLLILVGKRRRLMKYFQRTSLEKYRSLIKDLGLGKSGKRLAEKSLAAGSVTSAAKKGKHD